MELHQILFIALLFSAYLGDFRSRADPPGQKPARQAPESPQHASLGNGL
jgi:hypothetical protein